MINKIIQSLREQSAIFQSQQNSSQAAYISLNSRIEPPILLANTNAMDSFFISKPDTGLSLLGIGSFISISAQGNERFATLRSEFNKILNKWFNNKTQPSEEKITPIAFLGFAFDAHDSMKHKWQSFPNSTLIIPDILIKEQNGQQTLTANIKLEQASNGDVFDALEQQLRHYLESVITFPKVFEPKQTKPAPSAMDKSWQQLTHKALAEIASGQFDKLVISRQLTKTLSQPIYVPKVLENLKQHYPSCTLLSYHSEGQTIIAASPETLLKLDHPVVYSDAIGGTVQRKKSDNSVANLFPSPLNHSILPNNDESPESKKLLKEHLIIAQDIYHRLDPLCKTLKMPVFPMLMKLHNLYHLETPIQGHLMDQHDIFDVIETLHPTPAVAGYPSETAQQWLLDNEDYQRGWYTGAFGWIDGHLNGELSVMLRCALIQDSQVNLFAGAGLVAESNPELEWHETELKMQTILEML